MPFPRPFLLVSLAAWSWPAFAAEEAAKTDARYPFRTDFANAALPWYQPKPLEFPPHHSDRRITGQLISADFLLRKGQFRMSKTGEVVDFFLPPYASVHYLKAEADLRDAPLGTDFLFFLNDDGHGHFTRLATMQEQFSIDAGHSFSYRLDEARLGEGILRTTKQSIPKKLADVGKAELHVNAATRVWKGDQQIHLEDLQPGDELLCNLSGRTPASPGVCTDLWVGAETHQQVSARQSTKFAEFIKRRGLPGWVVKTEGHQLTVTLFSDDAPTFKKTWKEALAVGQEISVAVANDELRPWNPQTDKEKGTILEARNIPVDAYGCSGVQLVVQVTYLLEGFRRGHVVRLYGAGWTVKDPPYGETLMSYGYRGDTSAETQENPAREYPGQFPFRTDFGNESLPWFQFKAGQTPPKYSEHRVLGELVKVEPDRGAGQFRLEGSGETVEFTLLPGATVRSLGAPAVLADFPPGTRCEFALYQDATGAFTQAWRVIDDFTHTAANFTTYRVIALRVGEGRIDVAWQPAPMKNYNGDLEQVPDRGQSILLVTPETRVWKGDRAAKLEEIVLGDLLLANMTSEQSGQPAHCTDLWVGEETQKAATEAQAKKRATAKK